MVHILVWLYAFLEYFNGTQIVWLYAFWEYLNGTHTSLALSIMLSGNILMVHVHR